MIEPSQAMVEALHHPKLAGYIILAGRNQRTSWSVRPSWRIWEEHWIENWVQLRTTAAWPGKCNRRCGPSLDNVVKRWIHAIAVIGWGGGSTTLSLTPSSSKKPLNSADAASTVETLEMNECSLSFPASLMAVEVLSAAATRLVVFGSVE